MNLYFDLRLRKFVTIPGQDTALESLEFKAGDGEEIVLQYGRSSESSTSGGLYEAAAWTAELLGAGHTQTIGIKESGDYSDGSLLCSTSTFVEDATAKTYTGTLDFNTTAIDTLLQRGDADDTDDVAAIENAQMELTFISSTGAKPRSSLNDIDVTIKHDIIYGNEGTPVNAGDPDQYSLIADTIQFLPGVNSQIGGTSSDLDSLTTVSRSVGEAFAFFDDDDSGILRVYELVAGTDAENAPAVIRPDDYATTTNEKVLKLRTSSGAGDVIVLQQSGSPTSSAETWNKRTLTEISDTGSHCTIASGVFNLSTGSYRVVGAAVARGVGGHALRIQNTTSAATALSGIGAIARIPSPKTEEITCVADVAGNLDTKEFYLFDDDGVVRVWFDVDNSGSTPGSFTGNRSIEVTGVSTGDSATAVASALATTLDADSKFSASAVAGVVTVTHADSFSWEPAYDNDSGFSFAVATSFGIGSANSSHIFGVFTVSSASDNYELQHYTGRAGNLYASSAFRSAVLQLVKIS
jgi:hypothetical protein